MKINELIQDFKIYTTNEELALIKTIKGITPIEQFSEREQVIIENLVRKSLLSKIRKHNSYVIMKND